MVKQNGLFETKNEMNEQKGKTVLENARTLIAKCKSIRQPNDEKKKKQNKMQKEKKNGKRKLGVRAAYK